MSNRISPIIISERIARLEPAKSHGIYHLSAWSASPFGADESSSEALYEPILRGYRHAIIKIEKMKNDALGLLPPTENLPAYAEVDEMFHPLPISEKGLEAVEEVERLIHGDAEEIDKSIRLIVELTRKEHQSLKVSIFERLREHFSGGEESRTEDIPVRLFHLLPWELFDSYLRRLVDLAQGDSKVVPSSVALPDVRSYFVFVRRSLARKLSTLVEKLQSRAEPGILLTSAHAFLEALSNTRLERFPPNVRDNLVQAVDNLANRFLVHQVLPRLDSEQSIGAITTINLAKEIVLMLNQIPKEENAPQLSSQMAERQVSSVQRIVRQLIDVIPNLNDMFESEPSFARASDNTLSAIGHSLDKALEQYGLNSNYDIWVEFSPISKRTNVNVAFAVVDWKLFTEAHLMMIIRVSDVGNILGKSPVEVEVGTAYVKNIEMSPEVLRSISVEIGPE